MPPEEFYRRVLVGLKVDPATIPSTLDTATWRQMVLVALGIPVSTIPPTLDTATWRSLVLQGMRATSIPSLLNTDTWRKSALAALGLAVDSIPPTIDYTTWTALLLAALSSIVTTPPLSYPAFWEFTANSGTVFSGLSVSATTPTAFSVYFSTDPAYPTVQVSADMTETAIPDTTLK